MARTNTVEDARFDRRGDGGAGLRTAIIVSHPLHLYRARWLFRRAGVDVVTSPTTTDIERHAALTPRLWMPSAEAGAVLVTVLDGWESDARRIGGEIAAVGVQ